MSKSSKNKKANPAPPPFPLPVKKGTIPAKKGKTKKGC